MPGLAPRHLRSAVAAVAVAAVLLVGGASPSAARPTEHLDVHEVNRAQPRSLPAASAVSSSTSRAASASESRTAPAPPPTPHPPAPEPPPPPPAPDPEPPAEPPYFAGVDGLPLLLPEGVTVVGFHEASSRTAIPLQPLDGADEAQSVIMGSRGRGTAATSAVDLALPPNWALRSPVTGTVLWTNTYLLYAKHSDAMVTIVPDARPDVRVVLLHVDLVHVRAGQRVVAGETVIARTARQLPFRSQIDRYAGHGPHVHLEVRLAG